TLNQLVIGGVGVLVQRCCDLLYPERREKAVIDAVLERVDVDRLAEVGIGIRILFAFWRCREAKLNSRREVFEDVAPGALVICSAAMALIDDDEIKEVRRVLAKVWRRFAVLGRATHEGLEDREEDAAVLW